MASYAESAVLAVDPAFIARVEIAIVERALGIVLEPADTPNHDARLKHARAVVGNPTGWAKQMAWGVAANTIITAASADNTIAAQVSGMWDAYSQS